MDCSPQGSSVRGILRAGILEWVTICYSRRSSKPGIEPRSPALQILDCLSHQGSPLLAYLPSKKRNKCPQSKNAMPSSALPHLRPRRNTISVMENVFVTRAERKGKMCASGNVLLPSPVHLLGVHPHHRLKELASQRGRCRRWAHLQCGVTAPLSQGLLG